jgi:hypothetical protein
MVHGEDVFDVWCGVFWFFSFARLSLMGEFWMGFDLIGMGRERKF